METKIVDVNQLPLDDEEKKRLYPEWSKDLYTDHPLLLEVNQFSYSPTPMPDFEEDPSLSLAPVDFAADTYIRCLSFSTGEVAAVAASNAPTLQAKKNSGIYTDFIALKVSLIPWDYNNGSSGGSPWGSTSASSSPASTLSSSWAPSSLTCSLSPSSSSSWKPGGSHSGKRPSWQRGTGCSTPSKAFSNY